MRVRTLIGTLALVAGLAIYALGVAALAQFLPRQPLLALLFYAVAGIAWVAPAALLTRWMQSAA